MCNEDGAELAERVGAFDDTDEEVVAGTGRR
jgi:hypothetical protein